MLSGLGSFHFARRYFGNRCFFLLLRVLRCFSSPGSLHPHYFIHAAVTELFSAGFPHSDICGSMSACDSPQLFAAGRVLLRRLVPWHPPCALLRLIIPETNVFFGDLTHPFDWSFDSLSSSVCSCQDAPGISPLFRLPSGILKTIRDQRAFRLSFRTVLSFLRSVAAPAGRLSGLSLDAFAPFDLGSNFRVSPSVLSLERR